MDYCLIAGPLISWIVEALKRIPLIRAHAQLVALILAAAAGVAAQALGAEAPLAALVRCVLQTWVAAIATHEVITQRVQRWVKTT